MIRLPFTREHFELLQPDPAVAGLKSAANLNIMLSGQGMTWIDPADGEVVMCGGYIVRRPGVGWLWFLPSPRAKHSLLRAARFFKRWVDTLEPGVRLEAHVLASFHEGNRFVEFLGLKRETGLLRLWDGRDDYFLWSRITGDDDQGRTI